MTSSSSALKSGLRFGLASAAVTGCVAFALLAGAPVRAQDANPVLAKVNGAEIRQSALVHRNYFLGPGALWLAQIIWQ